MSKVEFISNDNILAVRTDIYAIFNEETSIQRLLKEFKREIEKTEITVKKHVICYKNNITSISLSDLNYEDIHSYEVNLYLNGYKLIEYTDYYFTNSDSILINTPNSINDTFTVEIVGSNKNMNRNNKINIEEKTLINNVILKINNYIDLIGE